MPLVTLKEAFGAIPEKHGAVAGLVVLGWEDALAYVHAAEAVGCPAILQAGPGCRAHTPLSILAEMFRVLADRSATPVVAHLDHGKSPEECIEAIELGFSSVMYDGSGLPFAQNIENTRRVLEIASAVGVSVEAELGVVGYVGTSPSTGTDPEEARRFIAEVPVDALAISAGNSHLSTSDSVPVDLTVIRAIEAAVPTPLVLHGGSGIPRQQRQQLARETRVMKFNIGTELRQSFGGALRATLAQDPEIFDRNVILNSVIDPLAEATEGVLRQIWL